MIGATTTTLSAANKKQAGCISTVIPTHNRPDLLRRAVESVYEQTYRPIELLIIDDGSAEPVMETLFSKCPDGVSLRILRNKHGAGPASARNSGIRESSGRWIAFLDDDDCWEPDKLKQQADALLKASSANVLAASCQMILVNDSGDEIGRTCFAKSKQQLIEGLIFKDENLNPSTLLVDARAFEEIGLYEQSLPTAEDRQWLLRFLSKYDVIVLDQYLTRYTEHTGPRLTTNSDAMLQGETLFARFIEEHAEALGANVNKAMAYRLAKIANESILAGKWSDGIFLYLRAIAKHPREVRAWAGFGASLFGPGVYRKLLSLRMRRVRLQNQVSE